MISIHHIDTKIGVFENDFSIKEHKMTVQKRKIRKMIISHIKNYEKSIIEEEKMSVVNISMIEFSFYFRFYANIVGFTKPIC